VHGGGAPRRTGELDFAHGRFGALRRFTFERGDSDVSFHYYLGHLDE
jgi:hypothetical protein